MKKRILLDCDGVLSDFVNPTLDLIHAHTGDRHHPHEITQWDVFAATGKKDHEHILNRAVESSGFCRSFPLYPGSKEAVAELRKLGDVYIVTSPFDAPNWVYERSAWLAEHFGFTRKEVVHTAAKHVVSGDVLIDDSERNLKEWYDHNPNGRAVLVDAPWNRHTDLPGVHRVVGWDDLLRDVELFLNER
jgi:5'(3')-deoxyribonucleotidase